jgi:hypothetical protein
MSYYTSLNKRKLLTFRLEGTYDLCYLMGGGNVPVFIDKYSNVQSYPKGLIVYNPDTSRLETLELNTCLQMNSDPANSNLSFIDVVTFDPTVFPPQSQTFSIVGNKIKYFSYTLAFLKSPPLESPQTNLFICTIFSDANAYCKGADDNVTLINAMSLDDITSAVNTLQISDSLCCIQDTPTIVDFVMQITSKLSSTLSLVYPSLQACQLVDTKCTCPTLRTCWMYNTSNVPCCIQGNPADSQFSNNAAIVFKDPNLCQNAANDCSQWRFNTNGDVPCCIQRSTTQWTNAGYSTIGLQKFDNQQDCVQKAASTCNFSALLSPPTSLKDYYGLILESKFTSGCDSLRNAGLGPWGSSTSSCPNDPSPHDCYAGNCGVNYCTSWSSDSPYSFNQVVRCLPPAEQCSCPSGKTWQVSNPGQSNVTSQCQQQL